MTKIILTASFSDVADAIIKEVKQGGLTQKVAFFATAAAVETVDFYIKEAKTWFLDHSCEIIDMNLAILTQKQIEENLNACDIIYVSGGNTFYLLQEFKSKNCLTLIKKQITKGTLYIGESAGSIITAPSIDYAQHMDDKSQAPNLENNNALDIVPFYPVPHFNDEPFREAAQAIFEHYETKLNLVAISNNQALIVSENETRMVTV